MGTFAVANAFLQSSLPLQTPTFSTRSVMKMDAAASEDAFVPDMDRRKLMNSILLGSVGLTVAGLAGPYLYFFVPKSSGGGGGGIPAKDALGNDITVEGWTATHNGRPKFSTRIKRRCYIFN